MEKFINKETEGYALSQLGQTTPQRLLEIETNINNILDFLKANEQYTKDLESYQDSVVTELQQTLQNLDKLINKNQEDTTINASAIGVLKRIQDVLESRIKVALVSAYIALGVTLGVGVALWLTK